MWLVCCPFRANLSCPIFFCAFNGWLNVCMNCQCECRLSATLNEFSICKDGLPGPLFSTCCSFCLFVCLCVCVCLYVSVFLQNAPVADVSFAVLGHDGRSARLEVRLTHQHGRIAVQHIAGTHRNDAGTDRTCALSECACVCRLFQQRNRTEQEREGERRVAASGRNDMLMLDKFTCDTNRNKCNVETRTHTHTTNTLKLNQSPNEHQSHSGHS